MKKFIIRFWKWLNFEESDPIRRETRIRTDWAIEVEKQKSPVKRNWEFIAKDYTGDIKP